MLIGVAVSTLSLFSVSTCPLQLSDKNHYCNERGRPCLCFQADLKGIIRNRPKVFYLLRLSPLKICYGIDF